MLGQFRTALDKVKMAECSLCSRMRPHQA